MLPHEKSTTLTLLKNAEKAYALAVNNGEQRKGKIILNAFEELHNKANPEYLYALQKMKRLPVTIEEFMQSPEFMKDQLEVWPALLPKIYEACPDIMAGEPAINEYIMGGASSAGKSIRSMMVNAYALYMMNCFDWPQELFQLSRPTEIVFMFMSIKPSTAEKVLYKPFRQYFLNMPYSRKYVSYNKDVKSELQLEQNLTVKFASANVNSMIAHAMASCIVDEINFFARVERSKQADDGGTFDAAEIVHRTALNRRKGRFTNKGVAPGSVCISAQTKYKGDFTDRRIDQLAKHPEKGVIICRAKRYEVWPQDKFSSETFPILVGNDQYPTRILEADSQYTLPKNAQVEQVPKTFYDDFKRDPEYALREIVGIATSAITPFISQRHKIYDATARWTENGRKPWTSKSNYVLNERGSLNDKGMPVVIPENLPKDGKMRYIHVDLSISGDRCGIGISHIDHYQTVGQEKLPYYVVDWVVTLQPDSVNQIDISEVRRWVVDLKTKYGINIARVSYDSFNSAESLQMLRKLGIPAMQVSVDKTTEPYQNLRDALYTDRIDLPDVEDLRHELIGLEFNANAHGGKGKVDHGVTGAGKDGSDAACGSMFSASIGGVNRQEIGHTDSVGNRPSTGNRPSSGRTGSIVI